jgi:hypothetical protein
MNMDVGGREDHDALDVLLEDSIIFIQKEV